jgi:phosphoribosylformimino-5-aminoimidazole carboxamide ribotide isomerase
MIIYPAIDIRGGRVVRLVEGDPDRQTVHGDNPLETARRWTSLGAHWLHVVNLDGALDAAATRLDALVGIAGLGVPIQFGGGLRTLDDVERALSGGVSRAILGTMAVRNPAIAGEAVALYGSNAVAVALDARDGRVAVRGWKEVSDWTPAALGKELAAMGVRHVLYTDIARDGGLGGVNIRATADLAEATGLEVIASGGVASLEDVRALTGEGIAGVIIGKALYTGALDLAEALAIAGGEA